MIIRLDKVPVSREGMGVSSSNQLRNIKINELRETLNDIHSEIDLDVFSKQSFPDLGTSVYIHFIIQ